MAICTVTAYAQDPAYTYPSADASFTHTLVPTSMCVRISNIAASQSLIPIARSALPFGLLDRISVCTGEAAHLLPPCTVTISKTTGARSFASETSASSFEMHCAREELSVDADVQDADLKRAKDATGHEMAFRMIAAASIMNIDLKFAAPPLGDVLVTFYGANAVPQSTSFADPKPKLLFPALTPQKRIALQKSN